MGPWWDMTLSVLLVYDLDRQKGQVCVFINGFVRGSDFISRMKIIRVENVILGSVIR